MPMRIREFFSLHHYVTADDNLWRQVAYGSESLGIVFVCVIMLSASCTTDLLLTVQREYPYCSRFKPAQGSQIQMCGADFQ